MKKLNCYKNCCQLQIYPYLENNNYSDSNKFNKKKAGVILHNIYEDKVLIVQSRGNLWGFPKGTFEKNDVEFKDCAIRECFEETGILLDKKLFSRYFMVNHLVCYYYIQFNKNCNINIQKNNYNDANGIGWINIDCLTELINNNKDFNINYHAKKCLYKFFNKKF